LITATPLSSSGWQFITARRNRRATKAALATDAFLLVELLLNDYPAGAVKAISFETHGRLDSALTASSFMIPRLFGFSGTAAAEVFKISAFLEGAVIGTTDWTFERARGEKLPPQMAADCGCSRGIG
jgi:hypothetical protein